MHPAEPSLNAYVDQDLTPDETAALERHLESCETCRRVVDDLRHVVRRAAGLGPIAPPAETWARIARQHAAQATSGRRLTMQGSWLATAALVALATAAGLRLGALRFSDAAPPVMQDSRLDDGLQEAEATYEQAIAGLQDGLTRVESALGPTLSAEWRDNLNVLDEAIADSRSAVAREPEDPLARQSLIDGLRTKAAVLQAATEIASTLASNTKG